MKLTEALRNKKGSSMVTFALLMTVIFCICALVVDIGAVVIEKQKLQNALDAASLAGAQELPDTSAARNVAIQYITLNGYFPSDVSISFSNSNRTIDITGHKTVNYNFAKIIGFESITVSPAASAEHSSIGQAFDYVLFSGSTSDTLNMNGSSFYIEGDTHTNYKLNMNGSSNTITGACEACSTITINGSNIDIKTRIPGAPYVEMPDFSDLIKAMAEEAGQAYYGNKSFNSSNINVDSPIFVDGDININGSHFTGKGVILATGDITFNGSNLNNTGDHAVCFYSMNGDITINGSNAQLDGIVYAPNGRIIMNGSSQTINGRVISNEVCFNGSSTKIIGGTSELQSLPSSGVRLVR